jgi:hypothetical protein
MWRFEFLRNSIREKPTETKRVLVALKTTDFGGRICVGSSRKGWLRLESRRFGERCRISSWELTLSRGWKLGSRGVGVTWRSRLHRRLRACEGRVILRGGKAGR